MAVWPPMNISLSLIYTHWKVSRSEMQRRLSRSSDATTDNENDDDDDDDRNEVSDRRQSHCLYRNILAVKRDEAKCYTIPIVYIL